MKDENKIIYTREKYEAMKAELADLENVQQPANLAALELARSQGDLSENADYDAAKKRQGEIEARIIELRNRLENGTIADNRGSKTIGITDYVTFKDLSTGKIIDAQVVSSDESDVLVRPIKISANSPVGKVLIGKNVDGEKLLVETSTPYEIEIISFKHA